MTARKNSHWVIRRDNVSSEGIYLWYVNHTIDPSDQHFSGDHAYGAFPTFKDALAVMRDLSWKECGLALDRVPFYGLELGIDAPDGLRTCALDVAGFHYLEEATAYAENLRELPADVAMKQAEADGHMVSTMDAEDSDLHLPLVGATAYLYDPRIGTTWVHNLDSWGYSPFLLLAS